MLLFWHNVWKISKNKTVRAKEKYTDLIGNEKRRLCHEPVTALSIVNTRRILYYKCKLERAVDGAPWQIPTLKFLTPPAPAVPTRGMTLATKNVQYVFYLLFVGTHTKFGIKIFEIDMLMIVDLLTSPQGHQFDPRIKIHFVLLVIPVDLICYTTMFEKKIV